MTNKDKNQKKTISQDGHLSLAYNTTSDLMFLFSVEPDYCFRGVSVNTSYLNALKLYNINVSEKELLGKPIDQVMYDIYGFNKELVNFVLNKYKEAVDCGQTIRYEEGFDLPEMGKFYAEVTLTPIFDENGQCSHLLYVSHDITKRKIAEEELSKQKLELKRSNEELQQFAYIVSHDLQEPLRMVSSFVQLLEKKYKGYFDQDGKDFIEYIVEGATRMQSMLHGLLEYSRIDIRDKNLELINFNEIVNIAISNLRLTVEENGAKVNFINLPTIKADENQMIRLFQNLISNAIKYRSSELPVINISAVKDQNSWIFSVSDNGIGIEKDYFERIFKIFQRLHTRKYYKGEGLGLALCRKIIERHNGKIWFESHIGKGSTFSFMIPV